MTTTPEVSSSVQTQESTGSDRKDAKEKWSSLILFNKQHTSPSRDPSVSTPMDSAMNAGSYQEATKATAIQAVSSEEEHVGAVTGMAEPVNLKPPRVPRNMLTIMPYAVISFPGIVVRRMRGQTYCAQWSFRDEYVINLLRFTLGTPQYSHWRFLIALAGMVGRTRIPISLAVEKIVANPSLYPFTAYQFTLRGANQRMKALEGKARMKADDKSEKEKDRQLESMQSSQETVNSTTVPGFSTTTSGTLTSPPSLSSSSFHSPGTEPWVILYMHGGGYSSGKPMMHAVVYKYLMKRLQKEHGINQVKVVAIKYPLAPENPYPAAINSAIACLSWLREAKGIPMSRVILGGDSAGGGLCLAVLQRIKARYGLESEMFPGHAFVISPWVQMMDQVPSYVNRMNSRTDYLAPRLLKPFVDAYVRNPKTGELLAPLDHPQVSPGTADWSGVPTRILTTVGGKEIFYRSIVDFVRRAAEGGVQIRIISDPDMPHVYPTLMDFFPENSRRTLNEIVDWLADAVDPTGHQAHFIGKGKKKQTKDSTAEEKKAGEDEEKDDAPRGQDSDLVSKADQGCAQEAHSPTEHASNLEKCTKDTEDEDAIQVARTASSLHGDENEALLGPPKGTQANAPESSKE
ncbi:MAG: Alpha/Beta hydrolase protein [Piptocephalis tieghemiana]|nr:MAG: Alpha/Beta hydrolase protein [Piptocephalis tieghemiana]